MASCSGIKTIEDARRDFISELPVGIKERILERLPTRDAARTALLSTHWRNVWLGHGRLVFDFDFFWCCRNSNDDNCKGERIITYILLQRTLPVKKFIIDLPCNSVGYKLQQSYIDQWCLFLSRNGVEELNICIKYINIKYKLLFCIVSCPTIKQLILRGVVIDCPLNVCCIFPGVTSLVFKDVDFNGSANGIVYTIPNLEKLVFDKCLGIRNFEISSPKLESLSATGCSNQVESKWFAGHLEAIKTLILSPSFLLEEDVEVVSQNFPTAINLQVIELEGLRFVNVKQLMVVMHLLKKSPNLCRLHIEASFGMSCPGDDIKAGSKLLEDPDSCIINRDLKMLKTIKIEDFGGSKVEILFVKMLLLKSPALERVVIQESSNMGASKVIKILRKLLCFPRASTKAQIVSMGDDDEEYA